MPSAGWGGIEDAPVGGAGDLVGKLGLDWSNLQKLKENFEVL